MDVSELRMLYYGRLDILITFSNDDKFEMDGIVNDQLKHPKGFECYDINDVIGRHVSTDRMYAHVFRLDKTISNGRVIKDLRDYTDKDLSNDIARLNELYTPEFIKLSVDKVKMDPRMRFPFESFWNITKDIADNYGSHGDEVWAKIMKKLGYVGFVDDGYGLIGKKNKKITLLLKPNIVDQYDIVPIQKYRKETRKYIIDRIGNATKVMYTRRSAVAKEQTDLVRDVTKQTKIKAYVKECVVGEVNG
jgi:hypothetical protein